MTSLPPATVAELDQAVAELIEKLEKLVDAYGYATEQSDLPPGEQSILFMSHSLQVITTHDSCAELLACAIDRLHRTR